LQPLLAVVVLTVRAVTVAAGMGNQAAVLALRALQLDLRAGVRAALPQGGQRPQVLGAEPSRYCARKSASKVSMTRASRII